MSIIPDVFSDVLFEKLEKEVALDMLSGFLSAEITALWRSGDAKWAGIIGENAALKDAATAWYLAVRGNDKGLVLTVPKDLSAQENIDRFMRTKGDKQT